MKSWFRDNINAMAGYTPGFQPADPAAIKINTNENPYPPSPKVFEALAQLGSLDLRRYPPIMADGFRQAAAKLHGVKPDMILAGNGGDELLAIIVRCCCGPGRPLAYATPTYSLYPTLAMIADAPVIEVPYGDDYAIPPKLKTTGAPLTFLCNPNAPSTTFVPVASVAELAQAVGGLLLVDEAYVDFAPDNSLRLLQDFDNVIILRSMSKGYSLAGMRFGYVLASEAIIETMTKVKDSYNVNIAAQAAAVAALTDQAYFRRNVENIVSERARLTGELRRLGFALADSHTNFLLVRPPKLSAREIFEGLCRKNIYVRYFNASGLTDKLRISIGSPQDNNALLAALRTLLAQE